jgi:hypothetical protein
VFALPIRERKSQGQVLLPSSSRAYRHRAYHTTTVSSRIFFPPIFSEIFEINIIFFRRSQMPCGLNRRQTALHLPSAARINSLETTIWAIASRAPIRNSNGPCRMWQATGVSSAFDTTSRLVTTSPLRHSRRTTPTSTSPHESAWDKRRRGGAASLSKTARQFSSSATWTSN